MSIDTLLTHTDILEPRLFCLISRSIVRSADIKISTAINSCSTTRGVKLCSEKIISCFVTVSPPSLTNLKLSPPQRLKVPVFLRSLLCMLSCQRLCASFRFDFAIFVISVSLFKRPIHLVPPKLICTETMILSVFRLPRQGRLVHPR